MKKNILKIAFVALFGSAISYSAYSSKSGNTLSNLMLDNVEALAGEAGPDWGNHKYKSHGPKGGPCCESGWAGYTCSGVWNAC